MLAQILLSVKLRIHELTESLHLCNCCSSLTLIGSSMEPLTKLDLFFARSTIVMARSHVLKLSHVRNGESRAVMG
jgi:hypothetical protein